MAPRPKRATGLAASSIHCAATSGRPGPDRSRKCSMATLRIIPEAASRRPGVWQKYCVPTSRMRWARDRNSLSRPPDLHASISGRDLYRRSALSNIKVHVLGQTPLYRDREIYFYPAIHCRGLEMGRIVRWNIQLDAAISRGHIHPTSIPAVTGQFNGQAAIGGPAVDFAAQACEGNAAVDGVELDVAAQIGDLDPAIVRLGLNI